MAVENLQYCKYTLLKQLYFIFQELLQNIKLSGAASGPIIVEEVGVDLEA